MVKQRMTPIVAPDATAIAVHDELGLLIVAQRNKTPLSIYKLDGKGAPQGEPNAISLPQPDSLSKFNSHPTSVVLHPKLPLMYVWQDLRIGPKAKAGQRPTVFKDYDHLVIFELAKDGTAKQLGAFARGEAFDFGYEISELGIAPDGDRLFLPNLGGGKKESLSIGYYDLDEKGMPVPVPVPIEGSLDGFGLNKFEMEVRPETLVVHGYQPDNAGMGFVVPQKRAALFVTRHGVSLWDTEDRRGALNPVTAPGTALNSRISSSGVWPPPGQPDRKGTPAVYGVGYESYVVIRIRHAYGYPTLMPQTENYSNSSFRSAPVVIGTRPALLVAGGKSLLTVMPLEDDGSLGQSREHMTVDTDEVMAIAYSPKFDRLYVPLDKAPEQPEQEKK